MNANELADKLEEWYNYSHENMCNEAATMLRQQQEQIKNLHQWEKRYLDVIHSLERQLEIITEANTRSRP